MPQLDHSEAERIITSSDVKRFDATHGRASALLGSNKEKKPQPKQKGNIVSQQIKRQEELDRYRVVFQKVRSAVEAAEQSCRNTENGVQSTHGVDELVEKSLDDLIAVIETIRDERKTIIKERPQEEQRYAHLLP